MTGHLATTSKFVMIELLIPTGQSDAVSEETLIGLLGLKCHDDPRQSLRELTRIYYSYTNIPVLTDDRGYLFRPATEEELQKATARKLRCRVSDTEPIRKVKSRYRMDETGKGVTVVCDGWRKD